MTMSTVFLLAVSITSMPANEARVKEIAAMLPAKPAICDPSGLFRGRSFAAAERFAKERIPPFADDLYREFSVNGNRTHFEKWRDGFLSALTQLVSAEAGERHGRFVPAIAARLDALCAWPSWVLPAHDNGLENFKGDRVTIDLVSSDLARVLARILGSVGDALPAETVRRVRGEIERRVFRPYLDRPQDHWWFLGKNNWNAVCHCGCVIAALELADDPMTRARFVEGAERGSVVYLECGFAADGYCSEGMGYWNYGFGHFLDLGLAVRKATGGKVDYFSHPRAIKAMRYALDYRLVRGVSPKFADGTSDVKEEIVRRGLEIWPELCPMFKGALPLRSAFPDGQVWLMRLPDSEGARFAFGCKGGHNAEHHNHNDVGSYNVLIDGELIAGDVGGEVYTARTFGRRRYDSQVLNSYGHPVPRVGGRLQLVGREAAAKVLETDFTDAKDMVVLDISRAYDCPTLSMLTRTFAFDRAAKTVTVTDCVRFIAPTDFETAITTTKPDKLKGRYSVSVVGGEWEEIEEKMENPGRDAPYRRTIRLKFPVKEATVSVVFGLGMDT